MAQSQGCQCGIAPQMATAGKANTLCHHSDPEEVRNVQSQLYDILDGMAINIPAEDLFTKPFSQVAEDFMKKAVGDDYNLLNPREHNILMSAFLRQVSIGAQALTTSIILRVQEP